MVDRFYVVGLYGKKRRYVVLNSNLELIMEQNDPIHIGHDFANWLRTQGVNGNAGTFLIEYRPPTGALYDKAGLAASTCRLNPTEQNRFIESLGEGLESLHFRRYGRKGL